MDYTILHDKRTIEKALRKNVSLNLYSLGDLDDFFWPYTVWFCEKGNPENYLLLYTGTAPGTLIALTSKNIQAKVELIKSVLPFLPRFFNVHITPGILKQIPLLKMKVDYKNEYRMILTTPPPSFQKDSKIRSLGPEDWQEITTLYKTAYPGNWFDRRMLETGMYRGFYEAGGLVGIAGIHVYSPAYKAAALGNITTHPDWRGKGICRRLVASLCADLSETVNHIGLNVKIHNGAAIKSYEACGFEITAELEEKRLENSWTGE